MQAAYSHYFIVFFIGALFELAMMAFLIGRERVRICLLAEHSRLVLRLPPSRISVPRWRVLKP
jgi:hypothetical protein